MIVLENHFAMSLFPHGFRLMPCLIVHVRLNIRQLLYESGSMKAEK